jgi:small-conductance mechanosensitive channel
VFLTVIFLSILLWGQTVGAVSPQQLKLLKGKNKGDPAQTEEKVQLPAELKSDQIDDLVAPLSDEQARQLLIEKLRKEAELAAAAREKSQEEELTGLAGFVSRMRGMVNFTRARIKYLTSGATAVDDELPRVFAELTESEGEPHPVKTPASVIALFAASLLVFWLSRRFTAPVMGRLETTPPINWLQKLGRLAFRSLLDIFSICVFALATLALFFLFLDHEGPERLVVATYLTAFLIVMAVSLVSRLLLAPSAPGLRYLPLEDDDARYIHKWVKGFAVVSSFGFLTCGLMKAARISEAAHLLMVAMVGMVICLMLVVMILQKRVAVAEALRKDLPEFRFRAQLAKIWHVVAIFFVILLWVVASLRLLIVGFSFDVPGLKTLLMVPLFFILDWILQSILKLSFGMVKKPEDSQAAKESVVWDDEESTPKPRQETRESPLEDNRMYRILRISLRTLLAAFVFYWILGFWGIDLRILRAVAGAGIDIILVVLLSFVAWELIKAPIQRKLREELPDDDEEMEEGGAGGSRIATLLVLLQKFLLSALVVIVGMLVLSSLGVNIGPLIAGAGVVGLAIGFGAQTLVRDILSGVFFLVDDAFRVGDYVETGGEKGTVEHISIRSLRLRHHRGPVHTIPFGGMKSVTNFSRDYMIMKLDFRVRYDTDIEQVRKIIKKINKQISRDPEMGPHLLDKIKSQGVRQLEDSAMIMRVKFKTIPGEQFLVRREVYKLLQEAFREHGIEFAHRQVTVYVPPETTAAMSSREKDENSGKVDKKKIEAAAAAGLAAVAEDEASKKEPTEK